MAKTLCAPLERVKIVLQVQSAKNAGQGMIGAARSIVADQGFWGLWRGNFVNCAFEK